MAVMSRVACTLLVIGKLLRNTGKGQALSMVDHVFLSCLMGPCLFFNHFVVVFVVSLATEDQSFSVLLFLCVLQAVMGHTPFFMHLGDCTLLTML